jgi:hypothetical protein
MGLLLGVAFAMLASSLWMAIGPQLPVLRTHRRTLGWLTWLASRGAFLALALRSVAPLPALPWHALLAVAGQGFLPAGGAMGTAAGPVDLPPGGAASAVLLLAIDLAAWRALAAAEGDGGEAAWNWVASPLTLWIGVVLGAPRLVAVALVAFAHLLGRRGRETACGAALGAAAAWGGPVVLAVALAMVFAPGRTRARAGAAIAAGGALSGMLRFAAPAAWNWTWLPPAQPGGGVSSWRLVHALTGFTPGAWAWLAALALLAAGFAWLRPRRAGAPAYAAWAFGACALFAPCFPAREVMPFAPLLAVWAADDPDRRGWWFITGLALALGVALEPLALGEGGRVTGQLIGWAGIAAATLLALWPLSTLLRAPAAAPVTPRP